MQRTLFRAFPVFIHRLPRVGIWAVLMAGPLLAQDATQTNSAPAPPPANTTQPSPSPAPASSGTTNQEKPNSDSSNQLPHLDLGNETISWNGKVWSLTDHRLMRARLEKYLTAPTADVAQDEAYRQVLAEIVTHLSPHRNQGRPDLPKAVSLLPAAAEFDIDARLCETLANAIYGVWLAQRNIASLEKTNQAMSDRVRNQTFIARHASTSDNGVQASRQRNQSQRNNNQNSQGNPNNQNSTNSTPQAPNAQPPSEQQTLRSFAAARHMAKILEMEAKIKTNEALMGTSELVAKTEFQGMILQFAAQRRFEHVLLACRFYRNLFRDASGKIVLEDGSAAQKAMVNTLGNSPTINALDAFASEAIRDVDEGISSFYNLLDRGDLASASQRISEAFLTGEYLPAVRRVPMDQKSQVLEFTRDSHQLLSAMEMKDYTLADTLVTKMRLAAKDFDYSKPLAVIQTAKTASDMHLNKAKVSAMRGNETDSTTALTEAAKIWPTNPKLKEFTNMIGENADIKTQTVLDLDRLIGQKNYRQIYNDQGRFLAAVLDDPERQETLKKVLTDMNQLNLIIAGAQSLMRSNNAMGAWESVERAYAQFPDDPEIARMRSDLSLQATEFVSAIHQARHHESKKQVGSSLSWFLKAKQIYPPSEIAREGIQRQVDSLHKKP